MTDTTLISRLTNPDPKIRQQAFFELKKLEKAQALEVLIESLTNDDPTILEELYQKIREIAPNHLSVLVKKLKHPNLKIRAELVKLLREVGNNTISAELVNLLLEPPEIRACAIEALGYIKDPWSLNYIRDFIFDRSAEVRIATAKALGYFEDRESADQLLRLLTDPETNVRLAAIEALAMIKEARAGEHLWELSLNDPNDEVRRRALWALKTIGDTTIKSYEKNLGSDDIELRNQTIAELVRYGKVMLFPMLNLTYHPTPQVRELAVKVLGELKEPAAVTRLIELANDFSPEVRQSALGALGKIKSEEAIRFLAQELENPNPQIADTAKELLSSIGKNSVKILLELLPNSTTETQLKIIEIIGKMGAHELLDVIKEKLNDPRVWVRRALCEALSNFRHPEVANLLVEKGLFDPDTIVRASAVRALGKLKMLSYLDPILSALQDNEETVRLEAIRSLAELGEKSVGRYLLRFLTQGTDEEKVTAIKSLQQLNYFDALPLLKQMARGWPFGKESQYVRTVAKEALKYLTEEFYKSRP